MVKDLDRKLIHNEMKMSKSNADANDKKRASDGNANARSRPR